MLSCANNKVLEDCSNDYKCTDCPEEKQFFNCNKCPDRSVREGNESVVECLNNLLFKLS